MKKLFSLCLICLLAMSAMAQRAAVMEFKAGVGISQADVDGLSGIFTTYFRPSGYTMIERTQIDRIIEEQRMQRSSLTEDQMIHVGELLNLSKIVIGDVNIVMGQYNVDVRVINVESSTIAATEGATFDGSSYREGMKNLAQKLAAQIAISAGPTVGSQPTPPSTPEPKKRTAVETVYGYLHVFPNELGVFQGHPNSVIANINNQGMHGYDEWRVPTNEELSLLRANGYLSGAQYMTKENASGMVLLVTTGKSLAEKEEATPAPAVNQDFTETAYGVNMKMIWVEGGEFLMGCTSEQGNNCYDDEENVRRVTVDGFYIGMLEVTQAQWEKVMGTTISQQWTKADITGSPTRGVGDDYPMYCVNWEEAMEFCRLLSIQTGKTYTLPTEAQWEYAARGGCKNDGTKYAGSHLLDAVGWYADNSGDKTNVVGSKRANALGIYDMSGNVWEWCKDWYASSYSSYDTNNPTGPSSGSGRVIRGGSWGSSASYCRVADRNCGSPGVRDGDLGFRVVLLP